MIRIKAFNGYRPRKEYVEEVQSPPYDVIESAEAKKVAGEKSFLHIVKPEIDLPDNFNQYSVEVYEKGRENLQNFIEHKIFVEDKKPALYIYVQSIPGHEQTGLVALASCQDYEKNLIKKHELTVERKEKDRINHIKYLEAHTGPVFLFYKDMDEITGIVQEYKNMNEPEYSFDVNGVQHIFYCISDKEIISTLVKAFKLLPALYIADGHHRAKSAYEIYSKNKINENTSKSADYFLSVIFPKSQMRILPYNRAVRDLNGLQPKLLIQKIEDRFDFQKTTEPDPQTKGCISFYTDGDWYTISLKSQFKRDGLKENLDVSILQDYILKPIFDIKDPRKDHRLSFIGGDKSPDDLKALVDSGEYKIAFSLFPTSIDDLISISDSNLTMPPKSTWFEPKLRSGLVFHKF